MKKINSFNYLQTRCGSGGCWGVRREVKEWLGLWIEINTLLEKSKYYAIALNLCMKSASLYQCLLLWVITVANCQAQPQAKHNIHTRGNLTDLNFNLNLYSIYLSPIHYMLFMIYANDCNWTPDTNWSNGIINNCLTKLLMVFTF